MAQFRIPASPTKYPYQSSEFLGADFTSESSTVSEDKSPNVLNMIRSVPGKIRKRMGYHRVTDYGATIYGMHHITANNQYLIHAGTKLYLFGQSATKDWGDHDENEIVTHEEDNIVFLTDDEEDNMLYDGMAEHRSVSFQLGQKLVILDGTSIKIYDGKEVKLLTEAAYIPTLTISKNPDGGGTDYEPLNMVQPGFIEQFVVESGKASTKTFQMTFGELDATTVQAWVLNGDGNWIQKTEGRDFTVNRTTGVITFATAPGATPVTGEDNVKIQAYRTVEGYADRINHCTIGALFGVNGANDRLFISGNPDMGQNKDGELYSYINYDWFSEQYDPTYFGDTWYAKLGSDASAIMGYSIINNYLAAHKDYNEESQSVLIREGNLVDSQPSFKLINTLQGAGAISKYCFSYLATEPVFLTPQGIFAVTAQDVTGEKYAQNRSYYLDGKLKKEEGLENAHSLAWNDYYILAINNRLYILDGLQPIRTDRSRPYATRQYAGFYFDNIPASALFTINNELYFGTADGKVMKWYTDETDVNSYNDDGEPISCVWETCDISEKAFYKNKTYRYIAVRCPPEITSSIQIWGQKNGLWEQIKTDTTTLKYFSFKYLVFSKMTFSTNRTQRVTASKMRLKKLDHARFRFSNDVLNEPLGINDYAIEFTQAGNRK